MSADSRWPLAFALSEVTEAIHEGNPGERDDWTKILIWLDLAGKGEAVPQGVKLRRLLMAASIERWLKQPNCYLPSVLWSGDSLQVKPVALGVLGVVGLQLAVQLTRTPVTVCSGCGRVIEPSSRATRGKRRYCPKCRLEKKPIRDAKADFRQKRRDA